MPLIQGHFTHAYLTSSFSVATTPHFLATINAANFCLTGRCSSFDRTPHCRTLYHQQFSRCIRWRFNWAEDINERFRGLAQRLLSE